MDNGVIFEVECVEAEAVRDEVMCSNVFWLSNNTELINEGSLWLRIAYGLTYAFAGVRQEDDKLEVLVDDNGECPAESLAEMIAEGIKRYADNAGIKSVEINCGDNQ